MPYIEMTFHGMVHSAHLETVYICKPGEILPGSASCGVWKTQVLVATATVWNNYFHFRFLISLFLKKSFQQMSSKTTK